jgi:antitoxin (DNA-binding transcriptional repressor) of toxin-antitoxin stability system
MPEGRLIAKNGQQAKNAAKARSGVWPVQDAKAKLSEILRLARAGRPQTIGAQDPCIVLSASQFERMRRMPHLGAFLLASAPKTAVMDLPPRADRRGDPFFDD